MIARSSINQLLSAGFYPEVEDLCFGKDVTTLESDLATAKAENEHLKSVVHDYEIFQPIVTCKYLQAENGKLREVFKDYWIDQEKVHTDRTYQAFIGLGKHFDNWLKQKLEGK